MKTASYPTLSALTLALGLSWSAFSGAATAPPPGGTPPSGCSSNAPCLAPSQQQVDQLFGKIEKAYPGLFVSGSATSNVTYGADQVYLRTYAAKAASPTGLATYRGGVWYQLAGTWRYYGSLDTANQQFCDNACWNNPGGAGTFTMAQTISDEAQRTTLAFSGLAMLTGNLAAQSFFPPGKVADYTGFQYLRDNDPDGMGHNTSFLTRVANNVLYILTDSQLTTLKNLAVSQLDQINLYGYKRFPLMQAFRRTINGDIPSGSSGLNLNAVKKASSELYVIDGQISFDRALAYADMYRSMSATQIAYLDAMKGKGWKSWPDITDAQIKAKMSGLPQGTAVAVMTYASDLFSWYAGSIDADVYFCPERHGTYFGSFYIKDAPAIGHEGYSINEQLTATAGSVLSDSSKGYVTTDQATLVSSLVDTQRNNLYASPTSNIVGIRTQIATLLRGLIASNANAASVKSQVLALSATYGELDGANNYAYADVFAKLNKTLSAEQMTKLTTLRKSIMSGTYADGTAFDFSVTSTPYLYSQTITDQSVLSPYISNTDYLFVEP